MADDETQTDAPALPAGDLMRGRKGVVMGVANRNSIAHAIAAQLAAQGAEMAWTYLDAMERRVKPLGEAMGVKTFVPAEVTDEASMKAAFETIGGAFGGELDFLVHAIAFSDKNELKGSFVENTSKANFLKSMEISAWSWVEAARLAAPMMKPGGSMLTLTYLGSERTIPNYNVMGVAKAALEAATRYIARDLGPKGIRVNAISAGAIRTLSLAGISGGRSMIAQGRAWSALKEDTQPEGVAGCALWLLSDLGRSTTGEVIHVDAGFHMIGLPEDEAQG